MRKCLESDHQIIPLFWRIEDTKKTFRNELTFNIGEEVKSILAGKSNSRLRS